MAGKYSARRPRGPNQDTLRPECPSCPSHYRPHNASRCPAQGKTCVVSKKKNHFAGSPTCQGRNTTRALEDNNIPTTYSYDNQPVSNLEVVEIGQISTTNLENKITLHINNKEMQLLVDLGCKKTIIPQTQYTKSLGQIKPSKTRFRPYGTQEHHTTLGEVPVSLQFSNGAQHSITIYVVQGHKIEPLLGDEDAKALGILAINKGGHRPQTLTQFHQLTLQASQQTYKQLASK